MATRAARAPTIRRQRTGVPTGREQPGEQCRRMIGGLAFPPGPLAWRRTARGIGRRAGGAQSWRCRGQRSAALAGT